MSLIQAVLPDSSWCLGLVFQVYCGIYDQALCRPRTGSHSDNHYIQSVWLDQALTSGSSGREAYVTLLYGEDFLLGVRVLGQSLRETGTTRCATLHFPHLILYAVQA